MRMTTATSDDIRRIAVQIEDDTLERQCLSAGHWPPDEPAERDRLILHVADRGLEFIDDLDSRSADEIKEILDSRNEN